MAYTKEQAVEIAGTLSNPSKMPAYSYGLPAEECITGSKLASIAGTVCSECYALKGFYKTYAKTVKPAQYRRLESLTDPRWVSAMVTLISSSKKTTYFRWHDSGDLQSVEHLRKIVAVAVALPSVHFWLPTREYAIVEEYLKSGAVFPRNLVVRLSAHKVDGPVPDVDGCKVSSVFTEMVPRGARECPSRFQNNECGYCRACWDSKVKHVSYHKH
jgi:hypothetical protein